MAVVTGAGGDLAGTVVPALLNAGWRVALTARPGSEAVAAGRFAELNAAHGTLSVFGFDLADPGAVTSGFQQVKAEMGAPEALIHLAGHFEGGPAPDAGPLAAAAAFQRALDGNLTSTVNVVAALLPDMLSAGRGAIVAVGAAAGSSPAPNSVAYAAAKGALAAYLRSLAAQVGKEGVSVSIIVPQGAFDTPGNRDAMPKADRSGWIAPDAFAEAVEFLLGRRARGYVHELQLSAR